MNESMLVLLSVGFVLLLVGAPIWVVIGLAASSYVWLQGFPAGLIVQRMFNNMDSFLLLAVPMSLPRRDHLDEEHEIDLDTAENVGEEASRGLGKIDPSSDQTSVATIEDRMLEPTAAEPAGPGAPT